MPQCFWRWRFQPVWGLWGHLGLDYTYEHPQDARMILRHVDYGLPGERWRPGYRQSIALYCAMASPRGEGWPPLRTPRGSVFIATRFVVAPSDVGEYLMSRLPRFWGPCGGYRSFGPNSNTGLRLAVEQCERETGYSFKRPPPRIRFGALGWGWRGELAPHNGPCAGYFDGDRFRFRQAITRGANSDIAINTSPSPPQ